MKHIKLYEEFVNEASTVEVVYQGPIKKYQDGLFKARKENDGTYTVFITADRQIVDVPYSDVRLVGPKVNEEQLISDNIKNGSTFIHKEGKSSMNAKKGFIDAEEGDTLTITAIYDNGEEFKAQLNTKKWGAETVLVSKNQLTTRSWDRTK